MTHYVHIPRELRGRKIIIAKEHITRGRGRKMFDTGTYANHTRTTRRGRKCIYTSEKGRIFIFCFAHIHKK
ncbi:Uncharacterized protein FWK35_00018974 [Aphis craccivora]|uniref:Uncharacterized protein n=1 Tax=Aphis craccivora TaxID=307492 RepID=A0A6G0ZCC4_APHCR|nr:Uncharacterized protein FWK35_00018974 [Aphis craccivora]